MEGSKFKEKDIKRIIARLYVPKNLNKNPAKTIKFIIDNKEYFPDIGENTIDALLKEHNITINDVNMQPSVIFDNI